MEDNTSKVSPSKKDKKKIEALRVRLIDLQEKIDKAGLPVMMVFAGVHGAGKRTTASMMAEWMNARNIDFRAYSTPSEEELERPRMWRYWRDLPRKGHLGFFLSSWYSDPLVEKAWERMDDTAFSARLDQINDFERTLADDGALILKFWMVLDRDGIHDYLKGLEDDPHQAWRVEPYDWQNLERHEVFSKTSQQIIEKTNHPYAPWKVIKSGCKFDRMISVLETFCEAVEAKLKDKSPVPAAEVLLPVSDEKKQLRKLDMGKTLPKEEYKAELAAQVARLNGLYRRVKEQKRSIILVFEGKDAAGKGGAIRRLSQAFDLKDYSVIPIAKPTDEEYAHHYLWRFWRHLCRRGRVTIFDRSWYGRILVERIEGFAKKKEWKRAYREIRDFEKQLIEHGDIIVKYWIHVSDDEQLARFHARESTAYKSWKLTDEDWRNRGKNEEYEAAVEAMIARTASDDAPWVLIPGDDKRYARIAVIKSLCTHLERVLA